MDNIWEGRCREVISPSFSCQSLSPHWSSENANLNLTWSLATWRCPVTVILGEPQVESWAMNSEHWRRIPSLQYSKLFYCLETWLSPQDQWLCSLPSTHGFGGGLLQRGSSRWCLEFYGCLGMVTSWPCTSFMFSPWFRSIQGVKDFSKSPLRLQVGRLHLNGLWNHDCAGYIWCCDHPSWEYYCSLQGSAVLADSGGTVCCVSCEVLSPLLLVMWKVLCICTSLQEHSRARVYPTQRSMSFLQDSRWCLMLMVDLGH